LPRLAGIAGIARKAGRGRDPGLNQAEADRHMPIVDVEVVSVEGGSAVPPSLAALASDLGRVFGSSPGHTWVRLRVLPASCYAENEAPLSAEELPAFVTVLLARPPEGAALQAQVEAVTHAVAAWLARSPERVDVAYAPAASGRQAFGGKLV
jgi:phenylpyruvate tautomerase PptA (4-oxalocrotonate tautomerase family)